MRRALLVLALLLATLAPSGHAAAPLGAHETSLSVIEVHPFPDPGRSDGTGGDPFGIPWRNGNDSMYELYGAYWFPTARFDGVLDSSFARDASVSDPREFYNEYRGDIEQRLASGASMSIALSLDSNLTASANFTPIVPVQSRELEFVLALVEDDVHYDGGNGVTNHRFVVREWYVERHGDVGNASVPLRHTFSGSTVGDRANVAVVAFVRNLDETAPRHARLEVLQSATHFLRDATPTVQVRRSVLLELYTATWCKSCVFGDGAADLLANEFGVASALESAAGPKYFRAPSATDLALAAVGVALFALVLVPRRAR